MNQSAYQSSVRRQRTLVLLAFLLLCVIAWLFYRRAIEKYHKEILSIQDLFSGLVCFVSRHEGVMPNKMEDLIAERIVTTQPDGSLVVNGETTRGCGGKTYGVRISSINKFGIRWGLDLQSLQVKGGKLLSPDGNEVLIIVSPYGVEDSRRYSVALAQAAQMKSH